MRRCRDVAFGGIGVFRFGRHRDLDAVPGQEDERGGVEMLLFVGLVFLALTRIGILPPLHDDEER